jgi:biotin synthase-related radical SAM superfamily protein
MPAILALLLPLLKPLIEMFLGRAFDVKTSQDKLEIKRLEAEKASIAEAAGRERRITEAMRLGHDVTDPASWNRMVR